MLAYRVNLVGTHDHYLITPRQKPALDASLKNGRTSAVTIGGDTIRTSQIKSIVACDVDLESCPSYFQAQVKRESESPEKNTSYRKLPTEWILLTLDGKIIKNDISVKTIAGITERLLAQGDPEKNKDLRFVAAKCHFKFGTDGAKQYFTARDQIAEALRCFPNKENPGHMRVRQIYHYGTPQWR